MKKNIKFLILLLAIFLLPVTGVKAALYGTACSANGTDYNVNETISVRVGEQFTISCVNGPNQEYACDGNNSSKNNTGFCRNSTKNNLRSDSSTFTFDYNSTSGIFTVTAESVGTNYFFCDEPWYCTDCTNKCYAIVVNDENGNFTPEREYIPNGIFSTTPKAGYGCYYLSSGNSGIETMLLYTNRDMSGTGAVNVFDSSNSIQDIYRNRSTVLGLGLGYDMDTFLAYSSGQPMSADTCAAAGAVLMKSNGSGPAGGMAGNIRFVEEFDSGTPGVYDIFGTASDNGTFNDTLLLYGNGFKVYDAEYNNSDPYDCELCSSRNSPLFSTTYADTYDVSDCFSSINSQDSMNACFGCAKNGTSPSVDIACKKNNVNYGIYTIGILAEPDSVTNVMDDINNSDPNDVEDGTVTGVVDAEAGLYNWTCEDVKYTTAVYNILRLIAPFLLIIFASLDYFKAVVAGDIKKQQEAKVKAPKRLIAFLLLLVIPFIVSWMFKSFGGYGSNVMTAFCCVATNGNQNCSIGSSNSGTPTPTTPTNTSQVDEVTADNLCNGNNYLSPNKITTVCSVKDCINNRYGECLSTNLDDGICNKCEYTPLSISEELCTSNCGVGYKSGQCFFNVVKGVSTSSINNLANSGLSLIKKVHQAGTTGDYQDGYFNYDRKIKENVTQTVCTNELNGTPYDCDSSGNSCSCLYGNSIISSN